MFPGPIRARAHGLVAIASMAVIAGAVCALAPAGCSDSAVAPYIPGLQGTPTISILQVGTVVVRASDASIPALPCVAIGTDPNEELPILVAISQIYLRPQGIFYQASYDDSGALLLDTNGDVLDAGGTDGPCGPYAQCGHLQLYVRELGLEATADGGVPTPMDVYNNSGSSIVIPLLMRKLANRDGQFLVTIKVLDDNGEPIKREVCDANAICSFIPSPLETQITITTSATCPISDGGMGATSASSSSSGAGGAGGAGGSAASSGAGGNGAGGKGAGGAGGKGAGGAGGNGSGGGDASPD